MLEYNFNELDNDFITLMSRYLLTNDMKLIVNEIEALAELGQINAVQSWYLIKQGKQNANIDKILSSYNGSNFNEFLAMANAIDIKQRAEEVSKAGKYAEAFCEQHLFATFGNVFADYLEKNSVYFGYLLASINMAKHVPNNIFAAERWAELLGCYALEFPVKCKVSKRYLKESEKVAKEVKKKIEYILNQQENVYEYLKLNPQLAFAIAKNHWFFSKKDKEKQFAKDVLTDLSNRELSSKLQEQLELIKSRASVEPKPEVVKEEKRESLLSKLTSTDWSEIHIVSPEDLGV